MEIIFLILLPTIIFSLLVVLILKWLNKRESKIGINTAGLSLTKALYCPNCNAVLPKIRKPANLRQILWGGVTCPECGKEYDKWLREVSAS